MVPAEMTMVGPKRLARNEQATDPGWSSLKPENATTIWEVTRRVCQQMLESKSAKASKVLINEKCPYVSKRHKSPNCASVEEDQGVENDEVPP